VWRDLYHHLEGNARSDNTGEAKQRDLNLFRAYFQAIAESDRVDDWTKPVTTGFLRWLEPTPVKRGGIEGKRKATTVNRINSSVRHFAGWVQAHRGFLAGNPTKGVKELVIDEPSWKGLTDAEIIRLKTAAEHLPKK
jgi:site-specific recombinase XerD